MTVGSGDSSTDPASERPPGPPGSPAATPGESAAQGAAAATARTERHFPYGRPGRPLRRTSPFYIGFVGALGVLIALALAEALTQARQVIVLIVVSMFLAVGLNPAVEWLMRQGLRRPAAVAAVGVGVLLFFAGFVAAIAPPLATQTAAFVEQLPDILERLRGNPSIRRLDEEYGLISQTISFVTSGDLASRLFGGFVGVGRIVVGAAFGMVTVLILTLYFMASLPRIKEHAYQLAPRSRRQRVQLLTDEVLLRIGGYVSGQLTVAGLAGVTSFLFLSIIRLDYALTLSLVVAVLALVPMVGATLSAILVSLIALIDSPAKALAALAFYAIYQQFENYVIYPRVMRRSVNVPPALTIVAALVGGALMGVVGALLAIPTAAGLLLLFREVVVPRQEST
jgi:predicted PurR-regulated permease PerM